MPGLTGHDDDVAGAAGGAVPGGAEHGQLGVPTHEGRRVGGPATGIGRLPGVGNAPRARGSRRWRRPEELEVRRLGLGVGIDPEGVGQDPAQALVGEQRLAPVACRGVRPHAGAVGALPQGRPLDGIVREGQRRRGVAAGGRRLARHLQGRHQQVGQAIALLVDPGAVASGQERAPEPGGGLRRIPVGAGVVARRQFLTSGGQGPLRSLDVDVERHAVGEVPGVPPALGHDGVGCGGVERVLEERSDTAHGHAQR